MRTNDYLTERAEVPSPKCFGLISRIWKLKNGRKDKLEEYKSNFLSGSFNIGLAFYKYAPDIRLSEISERKRVWLQGLSEKWKFDENNLPDDHIYKQLKSSDNVVEVGKQLKKCLQMKVEVLDGETTQPLIVGLGEASPYETGITLDFITGLPIISGSALKGITRRAAILNLVYRFGEEFGFELQPFENTQYADLLPYGKEFDFVAQKIEDYLKPDEFIRVFGTQDQKGEVIFMDAYPIEWLNGLFRVDIMNPHYGPYYSKKGWEENEEDKKGKPVPPADWYDPNPIFYLTVNKGVKYRFIIASKSDDLLKTARKWLEFALTNIGVGAKGNQGYGVFEIEKGREDE